MTESYFKGYWMVTNRCNLRCSYCVLEDSPQQIRQELDLESKKQLVTHLYEKLNFRRLTLSGGEVLIIGKHPPKDFISLLDHIRQYRCSNPKDNLEIELYSNGTFMTDEVIAQMQGVVDRVAVTIDGTDNEYLSSLGRNFGRYKHYYDNILIKSAKLSQVGIDVKFHSVISTNNITQLPAEVANILAAFENAGGSLSTWKFYQYMSYDVPEKDKQHQVSHEAYATFKDQVLAALPRQASRFHFKDNQEMNNSLFNILSYGNAQYMRDNDSWSTSQRTGDLRSYQSMDELFQQHDINEKRFRQFHEITT